MANTVEVVGGLGSATDSDVLEGVTYTSNNGIKRSGTFSPIAENIRYDNSDSGLSGENVQEVIDEINESFSNIIYQMYGDDLSDDVVLTIREIANNEANTALDTAKEYTDSKIPDALADLSSDETHRTVTDAEKATWNAKSDFSGDYNDLINKPTIAGAAAVSYDVAQELTDEQQAQARSNIDSAKSTIIQVSDTEPTDEATELWINTSEEWNDNIPDCLPTVTIEDNGKILMVENGVWSAVTVDNAEGGSF